MVGREIEIVFPVCGFAGGQRAATGEARLAAFLHFGVPLPAAGGADRAGDDVDDLTREAGDVEARTVDDLDADDAVGGDAAEGVVGGHRLRGDAAGVDEDVGAALTHAAPAAAFADGEAGRLADHVERGLGSEGGVEITLEYAVAGGFGGAVIGGGEGGGSGDEAETGDEAKGASAQRIQGGAEPPRVQGHAAQSLENMGVDMAILRSCKVVRC